MSSGTIEMVTMRFAASPMLKTVNKEDYTTMDQIECRCESTDELSSKRQRRIKSLTNFCSLAN